MWRWMAEWIGVLGAEHPGLFGCTCSESRRVNLTLSFTALGDLPTEELVELNAVGGDQAGVVSNIQGDFYVRCSH